MADCFFCGGFVGEVNGDGGLKGRSVGNKDICEQCLGELKHWLNATIPRSPSMRTTPIEDEDDEISSNEETNTNDKENSDSNEEVILDEEVVEEGNPLSSGGKI